LLPVQSAHGCQMSCATSPAKQQATCSMKDSEPRETPVLPFSSLLMRMFTTSKPNAAATIACPASWKHVANRIRGHSVDLSSASRPASVIRSVATSINLAARADALCRHGREPRRRRMNTRASKSATVTNTAISLIGRPLIGWYLPHGRRNPLPTFPVANTQMQQGATAPWAPRLPALNCCGERDLLCQRRRTTAPRQSSRAACASLLTTLVVNRSRRVRTMCMPAPQV
jgi:hypothetical protein